MDPLRSGLNNANGVSTTNGPLKTTSSVSFVDRIKQVAQNILKKQAEIYDKIGGMGQLGIIMGGIFVLAAISSVTGILASPMVGLAILVSGLALGTLLVRQFYSSYKDYMIQKHKFVEQEFMGINKKVQEAKFIEQIDQCSSAQELKETYNKIVNEHEGLNKTMDTIRQKNAPWLKDVSSGAELRMSFGDLINCSKYFQSENHWEYAQERIKLHLVSIQDSINKQLSAIHYMIQRLEGKAKK